MLVLAFESNADYQPVARVAEIQTDVVNTKTTLVMFRVRNVIKEVATKREAVAEEMYLWGYRSVNGELQTIDYNEAKSLLANANALSNLSRERQEADIADELNRFANLQTEFLKVADERAENLVKAHGRFKELVGGRRYEKATPVLPPDVMGVYILLPKPQVL
jgi:hypothetical protein